MTIWLTSSKKRWFSAIFLPFFLWAAVAALAQGGKPHFETEKLAIRSAEAVYDFTVEMAVSHEQYAHGLMYRKALADDRGMLFIQGEDRVMRMWMKNTYIPLDMLFIDSRGAIVYIAPNTTPLSEATITAGRPVRAVLELAGGVAEAKNIRVGDRVIHPKFNP